MASRVIVRCLLRGKGGGGWRGWSLHQGCDVISSMDGRIFGGGRKSARSVTATHIAVLLRLSDETCCEVVYLIQRLIDQFPQWNFTLCFSFKKREPQFEIEPAVE